MSGEIDQVDEIIRFDQLTPEQIWNNQIKYTCDQINATGGLKSFLDKKGYDLRVASRNIQRIELSEINCVKYRFFQPFRKVEKISELHPEWYSRVAAQLADEMKTITAL